MAKILGISIGTRNVGLAVMRLRRLRDFRIRTFPGKWTPAKCEEILDHVAIMVVRHRVTDIVIKLPPLSHQSENIGCLIRGIQQIARVHNARMLDVTIGDLRRQYTEEKKCSKEIIFQAVIAQYPQLRKEWKDNDKGRTYSAKLFEAIAAAELGQKV
jgi:hypothetical protein